MKWQIVIILAVLGAGPVYGSENFFVNWWNRYDEQLQINEGSVHAYQKKAELKFNSLTPYRGALSVPPDAAVADAGAGKVLYSRGTATVLLVPPVNRMREVKFLNDHYRQMMKTCSEDRSWIVVLPENNWTEVDINPYCSMDYDEDQIRIDLYWTRFSKKPLIDLITGSLTCMPHQLFSWNRREGRYMQASTKCSGLQSRESYSPLNWRLLERPSS